MTPEELELRDALDELESAADICASAQKEGVWAYGPEAGHLEAIRIAREKIIALFNQAATKAGA